MKNHLQLLIIISIFLMFSCNKSDDNIQIKQLKIDIVPGSGGLMYSTSTTRGLSFETSNLYIGFNKNNYVNCKSIIFEGCLAVYYNPIQAKVHTDTCYLELFNLTDSTIIAKSILCTTSYSPIWLKSQNIISDFPNKPIDLTVRLRTFYEGYVVNFTSASLYLDF